MSSPAAACLASAVSRAVSATYSRMALLNDDPYWVLNAAGQPQRLRERPPARIIQPAPSDTGPKANSPSSPAGPPGPRDTQVAQLMSCPLEGCEAPACWAGVRRVGLDASAGCCPDLGCDFGGHRVVRAPSLACLWAVVPFVCVAGGGVAGWHEAWIIPLRASTLEKRV